MRTLVLAAILAACGKTDPGPACPQLTDHLLQVSKAGMAGHGDVDLGNRKVMIQDCERRKLSKTARECIMAATDLAGLAGCRQFEPQAPKAAIPAPAAPIPAPAPAPPAATPPPGAAGSADSADRGKATP